MFYVYYCSYKGCLFIFASCCAYFAVTFTSCFLFLSSFPFLSFPYLSFRSNQPMDVICVSCRVARLYLKLVEEVEAYMRKFQPAGSSNGGTTGSRKSGGVSLAERLQKVHIYIYIYARTCICLHIHIFIL